MKWVNWATLASSFCILFVQILLFNRVVHQSHFRSSCEPLYHSNHGLGTFISKILAQSGLTRYLSASGQKREVTSQISVDYFVSQFSVKLWASSDYVRVLRWNNFDNCSLCSDCWARDEILNWVDPLRKLLPMYDTGLDIYIVNIEFTIKLWESR